MKQVTIYARYSSDLQNDRSIEDQIASCKRLVRGDEVVTAVYSDRGVSGAFIQNREGIQSLLQEIETGTISAVLTEDLDRLSRSQSDIACIFSLTEYHGVELRTVMDGGRINDFHVGMKGTMSALELKKIAERTLRGQTGNIKAGRAAGGLPYGYEINPYNQKGELEAGHRRIVPEQAEIVKRIYQDYLDGKTANKIVHELNREGVPSPRGGKWNASTITGHWGRINGILQNPVYKGVYLWNRNNWNKHPVSGRRVWRPNNADSWVEQKVPHLEIIPEEMWDAVQERRALLRRQVKERNESSPKFDFVVFCEACGGKMVPVCDTYLRCYTARRSGTCANARKVRRNVLVERLFDVVRGYCTKRGRGRLQGQLQLLADQASERKADIDQEIATLRKQSENLLDAIADGIKADELIKERLDRLGTSITALNASRQSLEDLPPLEKIDLGRLDRAVKEAKTEEERRMVIDIVIGSVHLGHDDGGEVRLTRIEPDLQAIGRL